MVKFFCRNVYFLAISLLLQINICKLDGKNLLERNDAYNINILQLLLESLDDVLHFVDFYYYQINLDGTVGLVMGQAQLMEIYDETRETPFENSISALISKIDKLRNKIISALPILSESDFLFQFILLDPYFWKQNKTFSGGRIKNLGMYENWTLKDIFKNRRAEFNGITSNECLVEILEQALIRNVNTSYECFISDRCDLLMLQNRKDTGYLLTHRLFYLQVAKLIGCNKNVKMIDSIIIDYCSEILKETKSNEFLGFPYQDIFLEQVVLCGMEGFVEFVKEKWIEKIITWKSPLMCFKSNNYIELNKIVARSANIIEHGCTDHATGLGIAALTLSVKYIIQKISVEK